MRFVRRGQTLVVVSISPTFGGSPRKMRPVRRREEASGNLISRHHMEVIESEKMAGPIEQEPGLSFQWEKAPTKMGPMLTLLF